jgi:hypothetical protein
MTSSSHSRMPPISQHPLNRVLKKPKVELNITTVARGGETFAFLIILEDFDQVVSAGMRRLDSFHSDLKEATKDQMRRQKTKPN